MLALMFTSSFSLAHTQSVLAIIYIYIIAIIFNLVSIMFVVVGGVGKETVAVNRIGRKASHSIYASPIHMHGLASYP